MTVWQEALDSLSVREQSGKTAQVLIGAAEKMKEQNTEALRLMSLDYENRIAELNERIAHTEAMVASREGDAEQLRTALEEAHLENKKLTTPRRRVSVNDEGVSYTYQPGVVDSGPSYEAKMWRLDELESALMHLRMAGAADDTIVSANEVQATLPDSGQPVDAWVRPASEPEFDESTLAKFRRMRWKMGWIIGVSCFMLGGAFATAINN